MKYGYKLSQFILALCLFGCVSEEEMKASNEERENRVQVYATEWFIKSEIRGTMMCVPYEPLFGAKECDIFLKNSNGDIILVKKLRCRDNADWCYIL